MKARCFRQCHEPITFRISDKNITINRLRREIVAAGYYGNVGVSDLRIHKPSQSKVCKAYVGRMKLNNIDINAPCPLRLNRRLFCSPERWSGD